jgi:hypothetical protein
MKNLALSVLKGCKRVEVLASLCYGVLATMLYLFFDLIGGGTLGIWMILYFLSFPISWLFNQVVARMIDHLPEGVGTFLYAAQVIVAGMLWVYIVMSVLKYLLAKLRKRRHATGSP